LSQYYSPQGLEKLKQELEERKKVLRPQIASKISESAEIGDLKENAEYKDAKEMQAFNEGRIEELEDIIKDAVIISPSDHSEVVLIGSTIKVSSKHGENKFTIVGSGESSPTNGFISNESPLGLAFLGRKKDDEVEVKTPGGIVKYKITEIA